MHPPDTFAQQWTAAWNSHDLDRILAHYRPDVRFRSNKALALVGTGEVVGKQALRAYWQAALDRQPALHFTVEEVFVGYRTLVITYTNHRGVRAAETLLFDEQGLVESASACHLP